MKMLQQVMTAPGEISFREVERPVPESGEVLVRIRRIGVCGPDIHVWHGKHPLTKRETRTPGPFATSHVLMAE